MVPPLHHRLLCCVLRSDYDVHVTKDGRPASTQAYASEQTSPHYK